MAGSRNGRLLLGRSRSSRPRTAPPQARHYCLPLLKKTLGTELSAAGLYYVFDSGFESGQAYGKSLRTVKSVHGEAGSD